MDSRPKWCVIIVPGTWAHLPNFPKPRIHNHNLAGSKPTSSKARWFAEDSVFTSTVITALNEIGNVETVDTCIWSGLNSIFHRETSSILLAKRIKFLQKHHPNARTVILAHSHGGNVAVSALNKISNISSIDLVTLGTPFLKIYKPDRSRPKINRIAMWWAIISGEALNLAIDYNVNLGFSLAIVSGISFIIVLSILLQIWWIKQDGRIPKSILRFVRFTSAKCLTEQNFRLLVIRGIEDEAGVAIGFAAAAGWAGKWVSNKCLIIFRYLPIPTAIFLILTLAFLWFGFVQPSQLPDDLLTLTLRWVMYGLFGVGFGILIGAICNGAYCRELTLRFHDVEISLNSVPDFAGNIQVHTITRGNSETFRMRHALYNDKDLVSLVKNWLHFKKL